MLAADYPFLDLMWTMIVFVAWILWIWMVIVVLGDVFRRREMEDPNLGAAFGELVHQERAKTVRLGKYLGPFLIDQRPDVG